MTRSIAWMAVAGAMALLCAACASGSDEIALEDFPFELERALNGKLDECCTSAELLDLPARANAMSEHWPEVIAGWQASIDAGRVVYHASDASDALSAVNDMPCAELALSRGDETRVLAWLLRPFEGLVANGGACSAVTDCASRYCELPCLQGCSAGTPEQEPACKAKPGAGAPCPARICADGFYCPGPAGSRLPEVGTDICVAREADAMSCLEGDECASGGCNGGDPQMNVQGTCGAPTLCDGR